MTKEDKFNIGDPVETFVTQPMQEREEKDKQRQLEEQEAAKKKDSAKDKEADIKYIPDPRYHEAKTKRAQLLMQPSVHEGIKELADEAGESFNNYVHELLKQHLKEQGKEYEF